MNNSKLMADAAALAMIDTIKAEGIDVPERIASDLRKMAADTGQRVIKVTAGQTSQRYVPDGDLPHGVSMFEWQAARLLKELAQRGYPAARVIPPEPCYDVHVSENGITAGGWLREHGYQASSDAPFRVSLREYTG